MKKCTKCNKLKELVKFPKMGRLNNKLRNECRSCFNNLRKERHKKAFKYNIKKLLEYLKSHPCVSCGEKDPVVLEFDHIKKKNKTIAWLCGKRCKWNRIEAEIKNCQVLCANCHRRKTARENNWFKYRNGTEI